MHLTSLSATDVLSYDTMTLDLSEGLSVVVGPNGSGKTNLGRLIHLAMAAVRATASGDFAELDREWSQAGRYGSAAFEVRVGVTFDDEDELSLIEDWAKVAIAEAVQGRNVVLAEDLGSGPFLGVGEIVVRYNSSSEHPWSVFWQTRNPIFHLELWQTHALVPGPAGIEDSRSKDLGSIIASIPLPPAALRISCLADVSTILPPAGLIARKARQSTPSAQRLADRFAEFRAPSLRSITFGHVLDRLLSDVLTITENRRSSFASIVDVSALANASKIEDGTGTAVELLRLKNGDVKQRARFRAVQEAFVQITGRRLDVRQQAIDVEAEAHRIHVVPVVVDASPVHGGDVDIPLRLSGAGIEEAAFLALILTGDQHALVLDEPATNLAPVAQRRLLSVLRELRSGKQTILITHSAHLVTMNSVDDLASITRLDWRKGWTVVHRPDLGQSAFNDMKELLRQQQIRDLLFAAGVVFVEGPTEVDVFEVWLAQADAQDLPTPESAHVVFVSVGGDERFPKFARLLEGLGIPYAIVADGPAFRPGGSLSKLPAAPPGGSDDEPFDDARERWAVHRVRTLAVQFGIGDDKGKGEIEEFFERVDSETWAKVSNSCGRKDKPLLGYHFAAQVQVPDVVLGLWRDLLCDLGLHDS
jgi:energy-coupling factor transporter ATP-binding protein EcfA2